MTEPISPEAIATYKAIAMIATYLLYAGFILSTVSVILAAFQKRKTALVFGMLYAITIFLLPYKVTGTLGTLIFLVCLGCLIKLFIDQRKSNRGEQT